MIVCYINNIYDVFFREDTTTGSVFVRVGNGGEDFLIMNMSLDVGDTIFFPPDFFPIANFWSNLVITCDNKIIIDSIYFHNGNKVLKTSCKTLSCPSNISHQTMEYLTFIEGIGPNKGIFYWMNEFHYWDYGNLSYLLCAFKDTVKVYQNPSYNTCDTAIFSNIQNLNNAAEIEIYPNPTSGNFNIEFINQNEKYSTINIYDLTGKIIYKKTNISQDIINIDISKYNNGIYFIKIINQNNTYFKKLIKQ